MKLLIKVITLGIQARSIKILFSLQKMVLVFPTRKFIFLYSEKYDFSRFKRTSWCVWLRSSQIIWTSTPVLTDRNESACRTVSHFWAHFNSCISVSDLQKISDVKVACVEPCVPKNIWNYICEFRRGMNFDENHPIWTE